MIIELFIVLEVIAFIFLALGIIPFPRIKDGGNLPLANKIIFILIAATMFFVLSALANGYEYNYCFVNSTSIGTGGNNTYSTATCDTHIIEDSGTSAINLGLGWVSILIGIITLIVAGLSKNDNLYIEE